MQTDTSSMCLDNIYVSRSYHSCNNQSDLERGIYFMQIPVILAIDTYVLLYTYTLSGFLLEGRGGSARLPLALSEYYLYMCHRPLQITVTRTEFCHSHTKMFLDYHTYHTIQNRHNFVHHQVFLHLLITSPLLEYCSMKSFLMFNLNVYPKLVASLKHKVQLDDISTTTTMVEKNMWLKMEMRLLGTIQTFIMQDSQ